MWKDRWQNAACYQSGENKLTFTELEIWELMSSLQKHESNNFGKRKHILMHCISEQRNEIVVNSFFINQKINTARKFHSDERLDEN